MLRTRNPEVLSSKQRKRTVKDRSRIIELSGLRASNSDSPESAGNWLFHVNCRCNSSRSSEWTNS